MKPRAHVSTIENASQVKDMALSRGKCQKETMYLLQLGMRLGSTSTRLEGTIRELVQLLGLLIVIVILRTRYPNRVGTSFLSRKPLLPYNKLMALNDK